jgi:hypothetical protein
MLLYRYQNADQNQDIRIGNRSFESVSQIGYLGMTVTNQNLILEEIKRRLNSGNACYHSVYNLLSKYIKIRIYGTVILPMVLCGCETWFLALRKHRLRVFENGLLRRIFGRKRHEVTGGWRELRYEELCDLYPAPSIIGTMKSRRIRWVGHVSRMGEKRKAYRLLVGKPDGKRPLGGPRCTRRCVDNIKMNLGEIGWGGVDWIDLAQDRDKSCECGNEPLGSIKCWEVLEWLHNRCPL